MGTSLIRNSPPYAPIEGLRIGPYGDSKRMSVLMSEIPM